MIRGTFILVLCIVGICFGSSAQTIPFGNSQDTVVGVDGLNWVMYYYKPANYDSTSSPMIFGIHGSGGNGNNERNQFIEMADNRGALVVTPTMPQAGWLSSFNAETLQNGDLYLHWFPTIFKDFYRHIIARESRDTIWTHLIGFSQGGQAVTRYMLIRQAIPDSIPIRMAVSSNPLGYTFCTDSFNGVCMPYYCGIGTGGTGEYNYLDFICNEHAITYYNENYAVLIGTADISPNGGGYAQCPCLTAEGANRYERAQNFYAFSDTDAIARGTTLKWQYEEIAGVGHNGWAMYHTALDTASIAEHMLFDSPYNPPVFQPPSADLYYEVSPEYCSEVSFVAQCAWNKKPVSVLWDFGDATTSNEIRPVHTYTASGTYTVTLIVSNILGGDTAVVSVTIDTVPPVADFDSDTIAYLPNATVQFTNTSVGAYFYYWDFGDTTTSNDVNPLHTYLTADTFTVTLIVVSDITGCANRITKDIIVTTGSGIDERPAGNVRIYPNPTTGVFTISGATGEIQVYDLFGRLVLRTNKREIDMSGFPAGIYIWNIGTARGKVVVE